VSATIPAAPPLTLSSGSPSLAESRAVAWRALWTSRVVVFLAWTLAVLQVGIAPGTGGFDPGGLTTQGSYFGNLLAAPFARWDSVWYLAIAQDGYHHEISRTAFFPLYPLMLRGLGVTIGSDVVAGVLISLVAFAVALVLLHRLAWLDLGPRAAELTVTLIAFCPVAYFFSAVYTESLYLALSLGCILCARRGAWLGAGALGGLLYLYGPRADADQPTVRWATGPPTWWRRLVPRYRLGWSALSIGLIPLGLVLYVAYLGATTGEPLAPFHAQQVWFRTFAGPFGGAWDGAVAAWDGLRQLLHGPPPPIYFTKAGGDPLQVGGQNLMLFAFLILAVIGLIGVLRRLPFAYFAYTLASLAMPLSYPVTPQPLASLPRYEVVLFPLFMWAGAWLSRRRMSAAGLATLAVLLGLFTAEFATWRFVA
jgi:hypothetical protein